ncbi:MAG: DHH family phosphoesterase [Oscillospiraceae bacterium]|jgi:phosphoglycolate phosphatase|nr:DHH family phosphoesterase [Oscillospiraceae bacterium]
MYTFKLSELLKYDNIVIQCHDNPDADSISSAFGVYHYLRRKGKLPKIIYSGFGLIKKRNIQLMLEWLNIPVEYIKNANAIKKPGLLVCVDCQYGQGNVTKIKADKVAVIDHHLKVIGDDEYDLGVIRSRLGSCATLVWDLLRQEDFEFGADKDIPAALYYGLLTDTNDFSEINHPLDKDMRDALQIYCDRGIVRRLRLCNLTIDELEIAGVALLRNFNCFNNRYALFKSEFCDPNILGFISDIALQVDTVELCVVYNLRESGAKLSIRSCSREVIASEFAEFITRGVGSGGGHREKAGGWIQKAELDELGIGIDEYMKAKLSEYYSSYDLIDAANHNIDASQMKRYIKKPLPKGFAVSSDVFPEGTPVMIRTLEGDSNIISSTDIYLMVGVEGEVYPMKKEKFGATYRICDEASADEYEYEPMVKNEITGETKKLKPLLKYCISVGDAPIYASPLVRNTKIFTEWNPNGYMYGEPGDYLAIKCDDINDVYIIEKNIFSKTYDEA